MSQLKVIANREKLQKRVEGVSQIAAVVMEFDEQSLNLLAQRQDKLLLQANCNGS